MTMFQLQKQTESQIFEERNRVKCVHIVFTSTRQCSGISIDSCQNTAFYL